MKRILVVVALLVGLVAQTAAQDRRELNSANMSRAVEALGNNDAAEMSKWLNAELSANPKNGYAHFYMAMLYNYYDEYGRAVTSAGKALQYIPKKDKEYVAATLKVRATAYENLDDSALALADYSAAIKLRPKEAQVYQDRGEFYFNHGQYDLSDRDYRKCTELDPSDPYGYMGLGRNAKMRGDCERAIPYFEKAMQLRSSDYSSPYSFRAECYTKMGRFDEAASDIVTALAIDHDNKAYYGMQELADSAYRTIASRLKVQADREPNNSVWQYYLGIVSERVKKYDKAIAYYKTGYDIDANDVLLDRLSRCYRRLGNLPVALRYANDAIERDSTDLDYRWNRVDIHYEMDDLASAVADMDYCVANAKNMQWAYYAMRGRYKEILDDNDGALDDYTAAITLRPDNAHTYLSRGRLLLREGETAQARKDLQKCLALDTADMANLTCAFYAFHFLGDDRSALRLLDTLLAHDPDEQYNAACLYSLVGHKQKAIECLRRSLEDGSNNFTHIRFDSDLDNIRDDEAFRALIDEFRARYEAEVAEANIAMDTTQSVSEIPFKRRGGVTEVNCKINGLPLYFIFDTGAGDVTISSVEAAFMFKNGYLSASDVVGRANYRTASGDIVEGTVINLASIEIGDVSLSNVRASVVKGQDAPLLLGQSVLSRLGKIEIDNQRSVIKITYTK